MSKIIIRPIALLIMLTIRTVANLVFRAKDIVQSVTTNNALLSIPATQLTLINGLITKLESAETIVKSKAPGAVEARNIIFDNLVQELRNLMATVQAKADASGNEASALAIIAAAGFAVRVKGSINRPPIMANTNVLKGKVYLTAKSLGRGVSYEWQVSTDNGNNWNPAGVTTISNTIITGYPAGTVLMFRVRGVKRMSYLDYTDGANAVVQ
jgi:hypothetical protein